ncbi:helix-turn-helix domain-containing protein [Caballeronia sp. 15715]|jgi:ribosome-binding protein aMBF1 (putative translation factor)|uniref:helix-turn-helix domain-containing protein n=1 Tax=unclassified Caballeronia TaxID=2646786 RepID=UPI0039E46CB9
MKISSRYKEAFQQAQKSATYWTERTLLELTGQISDAMKGLGLSQKALSEKIDKKPAFLSRVLSGRHNVTLETVALVAHAMDMHLEVRLVANAQLDRKGSFSVTTDQNTFIPRNGVVVKNLRLVHVKEANDSITSTVQERIRKAA